MRGAVVIAIDGDVTVGMQLRCFPLAAVVLRAGRRFERGSLDLLEPFAAGDTKAAVGLVVDALDAHHQSTIDLGDRGKSGATEAEPEVTGEDFHEPLGDRFITRFSHARRNDCRGKCAAKYAESSFRSGSYRWH